MNDRLMIKSLISQGCNQFRSSERPAVVDSDRAAFTSEPRASVLCQIGYRRCVLWCNEQVTCVQKSQEYLNRVVPFHCGILLEESHRTRGGILSSILRRRDSKRRTMSKPNSAEMRKTKPKREYSATIFSFFLLKKLCRIWRGNFLPHLDSEILVW